jgi:hypothetical protein
MTGVRECNHQILEMYSNSLATLIDKYILNTGDLCPPIMPCRGQHTDVKKHMVLAELEEKKKDHAMHQRINRSNR